MKRHLFLLSIMCVLALSACSNDSGIGIIGGADGPTSIIVSENQIKDAVKEPIRMIKAEGKLYYDSGRVSERDLHCGTMDGNLSRVGEEHEIPKNDNECNFDGARGYQHSTSITKQVLVDDKWIIFRLFDDPELDMSIFDYCYYLKGTWPNAAKASEIVVLTQDINYDINDNFDLIKSYVGPDHGKYKTTFRNYADTDRWGISLSAVDVTSKGLTILCEQFGGKHTGELQTGEEYVLYYSQDDRWKPMETKQPETAWHQIAYMIKEDDITELKVDWEHLYGELEPGTYKLRKEFIDYRAPGDFDKEMYELYFIVR